MKTPLLVIIGRSGDTADSAAYAAVLRDTFVGTQVPTITSTAKELLQAAELREFVFDTYPLALPRALLESAERVLVVVLDARPHDALPTTPTETERDLLSMLRQSTSSFAIVNVLLKAPDSLFRAAFENGDVVRLGLADLEERDLRLPFLALYALHNAIRLFAPPPSSTSASRPGRLFFSHAKRDGVPLTTAVFEWMTRLRGFDAFYDTQNLDLDGDIDAQLESAIALAVVIVFRTDVFDQRYWCQKEVLWADQHGRPVITVDARWQIEYSPSVISFDSTPVVRIPDGNLVRIFAAALVEALRIELFRARAAVHGMGLTDTCVELIPRTPSVVSLHEACVSLRSQEAPHRFVVYPNPSLPSTMRDAAEGLARGLVDDCRVASLDEFRLVVG
jgi:hypothetical protein